METCKYIKFCQENGLPVHFKHFTFLCDRHGDLLMSVKRKTLMMSYIKRPVSLTRTHRCMHPKLRVFNFYNCLSNYAMFITPSGLCSVSIWDC